MTGQFARLALENRVDGLRAVHVPQEVAALLEASHRAEDPVEFLRRRLGIKPDPAAQVRAPLGSA